MKTLSLTMLAALFASVACLGCTSPGPGRLAEAAVPEGNAGVNEEYRLGIGDVISIRLYGGEEDLRLERVRLNDRGTLTLPFGEFKAFGQTTRELESAIVKSVRGRLLVNPSVWVNIDEYRPFFVQGQVSRPGAYPYQPGLNVVRAVTIAGGFRERASLQKIYIAREQNKGRPLKASLNTLVRPGDMVTVEESFF